MFPLRTRSQELAVAIPTLLAVTGCATLGTGRNAYPLQYTSFEAAEADFARERALQPRPEPPASPPGSTKPSKLKRGAQKTLAGVVVAGVMGLAVWSWLKGDDDDEEEERMKHHPLVEQEIEFERIQKYKQEHGVYPQDADPRLVEVLQRRARAAAAGY